MLKCGPEEVNVRSGDRGDAGSALMKSLMRRSIPFAIGALFLVLIGCGVYRKSQLAIAPPIYDPIAYYHKSAVVWSALAKGNLAGTLNGVKANRPPGTALLLYPFGFEASVRGFLFRSVLAPIVLWMLAVTVMVAALMRRTSDGVVGGCLAVGLATLPLFYHFEYSDVFNGLYQVTNNWGFVDALQAAVSALTVCLLVVGIEKGSLPLCLGGWLSAALTFFIKPSGSLVMAAAIGVAAIELVIRYFRHPEQARFTLRFAALLSLACIPVFGLTFWAAFGSDYMSKEIVSAGVKALEILRLITSGEDLITVVVRFIVPVIGWWWFCPMVFCLLLLGIQSVTGIINRRWDPASLRLAGCVVLASLSVCWWLFFAGIQHRYLFPFILMIIIWLAPGIIEQINGARLTLKSAIACYSLAPAFLLLALLYSARPLISLQAAMGINLTTGGFAFEVEVGRQLLSEAGKLGRPIKIYSIGNERVGVVEMIDRVKTIETGNYLGEFDIKRPLNWKDSSGLRLEEIVESEFLMMESVRPANGSGAVAATISHWVEELERFKQHFYQLDAHESGLERLHDGTVKVLRIANKKRFSEALRVWASSIRWENDFNERNRPFLADRE